MKDNDLERKIRAITRFQQLCLQMAEINDRAVEAQGEYGFDGPFNKECGLGYLAFSGILRAGVRATIDLQEELSEARSQERLAKADARSARDFVEDLFGDREAETLNDAYKERIRECVRQINAEIDANLEDEE